MGSHMLGRHQVGGDGDDGGVGEKRSGWWGNDKVNPFDNLPSYLIIESSAIVW